MDKEWASHCQLCLFTILDRTEKIQYNLIRIVESTPTAIGRDRMNILQDLGEVQTWDEVVDKALELQEGAKIDAIATVSHAEFNSRGYVATPLRGTGFSEREVLNNFRQLGPMLYPGHEHLRLIQVQMPGFHPAYPDKDSLSVLVVVYLRRDEYLVIEK